MRVAAGGEPRKVGEQGSVIVLCAVMLLAVGLLLAGVLTNNWLSARTIRTHKEYLKAFYAVDAVVTQLGQAIVSAGGERSSLAVAISDTVKVGEYCVAYRVTVGEDSTYAFDGTAYREGSVGAVRLRRQLVGRLGCSADSGACLAWEAVVHDSASTATRSAVAGRLRAQGNVRRAGAVGP